MERAETASPLVGIEEIMELMNYSRIHGLEKEFMLSEEYERRYGIRSLSE